MLRILNRTRIGVPGDGRRTREIEGDVTSFLQSPNGNAEPQRAYFLRPLARYLLCVRVLVAREVTGGCIGTRRVHPVHGRADDTGRIGRNASMRCDPGDICILSPEVELC